MSLKTRMQNILAINIITGKYEYGQFFANPLFQNQKETCPYWLLTW